VWQYVRNNRMAEGRYEPFEGADMVRARKRKARKDGERPKKRQRKMTEMAKVVKNTIEKVPPEAVTAAIAALTDVSHGGALRSGVEAGLLWPPITAHRV